MSYRRISEELGIPCSTLYDEVQKNGGRLQYNPYTAEERSRASVLKRGRTRKLDEILGLKTRIEVLLCGLQDSPESIAGVLRREARGRTVISTETIYQYIYSEEGRAKKLWKELRHKRKGQRQSWGTRKKRGTGSTIPHRVSIWDRPEHINHRSEAGHWEADLMIFSKTTQVLAVFVERKYRWTVSFPIPNKKASSMEWAMHQWVARVGIANIRSLTLDNGSENVCHERVRQHYNHQFATYFCDPYASWQKGTVENTNKLLRQYFPRSTHHTPLHQEAVDHYTHKLNNRHRKILQFATPQQLFLNSTPCSV